jgi:hypothetical protein
VDKPQRRPPRKRLTPEQRLAQAWRDVWETPQGRFALSHLLLEMNLFSPLELDNPTTLAIATGQRNVAARIARLINLKPDEYPQVSGEVYRMVDRALDQQEDVVWP